MTGKNSDTESDNGDNSLRGLVVALAIVGAIAGSMVLFAYASPDSPTHPDDAAGTVDEVTPLPEEKPEITEELIDQPVSAERIEYVNSTAEAEEEPAYVNASAEAEDELTVYTEKEKSSDVNATAGVQKEVSYAEQEQPTYTSDSSGNLTGDDSGFEEESSDDLSSNDQNTGDDSQVPMPTEPDEQGVDDAEDEDQDSDEADELELRDILPKHVLDLLDRVMDVDDDDKSKGKDRKGDN